MVLHHYLGVLTLLSLGACSESRSVGSRLQPGFIAVLAGDGWLIVRVASTGVQELGKCHQTTKRLDALTT